MQEKGFAVGVQDANDTRVAGATLTRPAPVSGTATAATPVGLAPSAEAELSGGQGAQVVEVIVGAAVVPAAERERVDESTTWSPAALRLSRRGEDMCCSG